MNKNTSIWLVVIAVLILVVISVYLLSQKPQTVGTPLPTPPVETMMTYYCEEGILPAVFTDQQVVLTLANEKKVTLSQVESEFGGRYELAAFTFLTEGDNASLSDGETKLFTNCLSGKVSRNDVDSNTFVDTANTFRFNYPTIGNLSGSDGQVTTDWMFNATTTGKLLAKVVIPKEFQPQTNFGDARLTLGTGTSPEAVANCLLPEYGSTLATTTAAINGINYDVISSNGAGAGNFYDTTSYRTIRNSHCYVMEYTIHSMNIDNYPTDQGIVEFDQEKIKTMMENIVRSLKWL